jgi:uncharacterized membrane protein YciS (DUF1049 family)
MMRWSLGGLLLCLLYVLCGLLCRWVLYGLLCRWVLCALCDLSTKLSIIKMKATLTNVNPNASATPLCMLCSISDGLCNLYLSGCPLSLLDG